MRWNTTPLQDYSLFTDRPLTLYLSAGEHTLTLKNAGETLHVARVELTAPDTVPSVEETKDAYSKAGYATVEGYIQKVQAEQTSSKSSQSIYPTYGFYITRKC